MRICVAKGPEHGVVTLYTPHNDDFPFLNLTTTHKSEVVRVGSGVLRFRVREIEDLGLPTYRPFRSRSEHGRQARRPLQAAAAAAATWRLARRRHREGQRPPAGGAVTPRKTTIDDCRRRFDFLREDFVVVVDVGSSSRPVIRASYATFARKFRVGVELVQPEVAVEVVNSAPEQLARLGTTEAGHG